MNLVDLRYSNALYIYKTICKQKMTVEEIAKATEMTPLTVNKILKMLVQCKIVSKITDKRDKQCGRPHIYYGPSEYFYTALILNDNGKMLLYYVYPDGRIKQDKRNHGAIEEGFETYRANVVRNRVKNDHCYFLGAFLLGNDIDSFGKVEHTTKLQISELLSYAYRDDERVVFIECESCNILINHAKTKNVHISINELKKIIDIDDYFDFTDKSQKEIILNSFILYTQKLLQRKI